MTKSSNLQKFKQRCPELTYGLEATPTSSNIMLNCNLQPKTIGRVKRHLFYLASASLIWPWLCLLLCSGSVFLHNKQWLSINHHHLFCSPIWGGADDKWAQVGLVTTVVTVQCWLTAWSAWLHLPVQMAVSCKNTLRDSSRIMFG